MEPPSPYSISISNESSVPIREDLLRRAIQATLVEHSAASGSIDVLVTGNSAIRGLNLRFRGIDLETDVLTFPADLGETEATVHTSALGDIAISAEYAHAQAALRGVELNDEIAYLGIHAALHLCGFDDETDVDCARMQIEMAKMGKRLDLSVVEEWVSLLHSEEETAV